MTEICKRWQVRIRRSDLYEVEVEAPSGTEAEERALELYEEQECEHVDGEVESVYAKELGEE